MQRIRKNSEASGYSRRRQQNNTAPRKKGGGYEKTTDLGNRSGSVRRPFKRTPLLRTVCASDRPPCDCHRGQIPQWLPEASCSRPACGPDWLGVAKVGVFAAVRRMGVSPCRNSRRCGSVCCVTNSCEACSKVLQQARCSHQVVTRAAIFDKKMGQPLVRANPLI